MKKHKYIFAVLLILFSISNTSVAQGSKIDPIVNLAYFNNNNHDQHILVNTKAKINDHFQQLAGIKVAVYITAQDPVNLVGKGETGEEGELIIFFPPGIKAEWMKAAKQNFIAVTEPSKEYNAATGTLDITKARIKIDTAEDKKIIAVVEELKDSVWTPIKNVDVKLAIKRLGGDLSVDEPPQYTTDSSGTISADFKRDSLPGDNKGNLVLVAKVEDNDIYGNLSIEKTVPWGNKFTYVYAYDKRTLFARRGRSPLWLDIMAYSIIIISWGVLLYLIFQLFKIKRLGKNSP
ncbi:MAG: hypothetical protein EKK37_15215 [Sphingobacteriales bacterium]|nr:MAG: hypothetical protein EKK37_15215 [Sphingobacteriales bacterium]